LFRDELLQLAETSDNFAAIFALTRERPRRTQDFGRRVDGPMMRTLISEFATPVEQVFVCGTNGFVNAAADGAVAAGVDPLKIRTERYGGP
jgi:ferredoxin-NADP reductase